MKWILRIKYDIGSKYVGGMKHITVITEDITENKKSREKLGANKLKNLLM